jgi:hypothetical protein
MEWRDARPCSCSATLFFTTVAIEAPFASITRPSVRQEA